MQTAQIKNTSSDFYFYDFTAKLLFDLNDKHSFRANIIRINNALNYAEYSNADQSASKVEAFAKNWIRRKLEGQWTDAFSTEVVTYFPDTILTLRLSRANSY
jgi:hypothetical protein